MRTIVTVLTWIVVAVVTYTVMFYVWGVSGEDPVVTLVVSLVVLFGTARLLTRLTGG